MGDVAPAASSLRSVATERAVTPVNNGVTVATPFRCPPRRPGTNRLPG
jgi:hypothetical protein